MQSAIRYAYVGLVGMLSWDGVLPTTARSAQGSGPLQASCRRYVLARRVEPRILRGIPCLPTIVSLISDIKPSVSPRALGQEICRLRVIIALPEAQGVIG